MEKTRQIANNRAEFARARYSELIGSFTFMDGIAGLKARKIDQAYRIWCHYLKVFNSSVPVSPSIHGRCEIFKKKRKAAERRANAINQSIKGDKE